MFVESAFITKEFKEEQIPILEKVTCLSVINTGTSIVVINGIAIYPEQKEILIVADGTFSRVQLEVNYRVKINGPRQIKGTSDNSVKNKILLIYKKLI